MSVPSRRESAALLLSLEPPAWHLRHSRAVAETAGWLALRAAAAGRSLDRRLVESAALLHDVDKLPGRATDGGGAAHAEGSADWLARRGYPELGEAIVGHPVTRLADGSWFERWFAAASIEALIVAYADKRAGQRVESMAERFASWERRYPPEVRAEKARGSWTPETLAAVRRAPRRWRLGYASSWAPRRRTCAAWPGPAARCGLRGTPDVAAPTAPLGYYWGDDAYGVARGPDALAARLAGDGPPLERVRLSGSSTSADEIAEKVATATMFGGGTLVVVAEPGPLVVTKPLAARLVEVFGAVADGNGLAFLDLVDGTARRPASLEALRNAVAARRRRSPRIQGPHQRREWHAGSQIAPPSAASASPARLPRCWPNASAPTSARATSTAAVRARWPCRSWRSWPSTASTARSAPRTSRLSSPTPFPGSTWAFLDAVGMRHAAEAAELADRLDDVPSPVLVVHLHRRMRELIQIADLLAAGTPAATLVRTLKLNPYRRRDARPAGADVDAARTGRGAGRPAGARRHAEGPRRWRGAAPPLGPQPVDRRTRAPAGRALTAAR